MDKIQCIKRKQGYWVINMDTLRHKGVSTAELKLMSEDKEAMNKLIAELDGEPFQKRLAAIPERKTIGAHLMPTYDCNYRCSYCYQKHRKNIKECMGIQHIPKIIEFYEQYNKSFGTQYTLSDISISGGEPFLSSNRHVMESIFSTWKDLPIFIITNGAYIKEYADLLTNHEKISLAVSVDGIQDIHYKKRIPTDIMHYEAMLNGVAWALSKKIPVVITCVFHPEYLDYYPSFFDQMEQLGWRSNPYISVGFGLELSGVGMGSAESTYLEDAILAFLSLREMDFRTREINTDNLMPGVTDLRYALVEAETNKAFYPYRCKCIVTPHYTFAPNGTVMACSCVESKLGIVGRYWPHVEINVPRILEIKKRRVELIEKCQDCTIRALCRGGCFATAISATNDLLGTHCGIWENPTFLEHMDKFFE